jgi:carbon monoxide dehydrogenase subunit G
VRVRETIEVARPAADVYATLTAPERRSGEGAWRALTRDDEAYRAKLRLPGLIDVDFHCRFEIAEEAARSVRVRGMGISPHLGFTFDGILAVQGDDRASTVETDIELLPAGSLAGLGQRRVREQARRLIYDFVAPPGST